MNLLEHMGDMIPDKYYLEYEEKSFRILQYLSTNKKMFKERYFLGQVIFTAWSDHGRWSTEPKSYHDRLFLDRSEDHLIEMGPRGLESTYTLYELTEEEVQDHLIIPSL